MKRWVCPFAMAGINTKIVRMTNGLLNNQYGKYFKLELVGLIERTRMESLIVEGYSDAGYSGTAKMITESALSLVLNTNEIPNTFGVLSTASGIGRIVAKRLERKGIKFNMR